MSSRKYSVKLAATQCQTILACEQISQGFKKLVSDAIDRKNTLNLTQIQLEDLEEQLFNAYHDPPENITLTRIESLVAKISNLINELNDDELDGATTRQPFKKESNQVLQFKVRLKGSKPRIWRRFQMANGTLGDLHMVLQLVIGWENCHLHQYEIDGIIYQPGSFMDIGFGVPVKDEDKFLFSEILPGNIDGKKKPKFLYVYDMGDNWEHKITFEGYQPSPSQEIFARCLGGENACPPEDVGGIWGYYERLESLLDPDDSEHEEMQEWLGDDFDPARFDLDEVNGLLKSVLKRVD